MYADVLRGGGGQAEKAVVAFGAGCFWGTQKFFVKQFGNALAATKVGTWMCDGSEWFES